MRHDGKAMPALADLMGEERAPPRQASPEEQLRVVRLWARVAAPKPKQSNEG